MKLLSLFVALGLVAAAWLFGRVAFDRDFTGTELFAAAVILLAVIVWRRAQMRKRARRKLEEMRDSALW
jgi:hypothetical protein